MKINKKGKKGGARNGRPGSGGPRKVARMLKSGMGHAAEAPAQFLIGGFRTVNLPNEAFNDFPDDKKEEILLDISFDDDGIVFGGSLAEAIIAGMESKQS